MEILPNVHHIPDIVANPYLLIDPHGLTLIDIGMPNAAKKVIAYIKSLGASPHDLKGIVITHSDFDHVGVLAALQKPTGARIYASQIEADAIASGRRIRPRWKGCFSPYTLWVRTRQGVLRGELCPFLKRPDILE